MELLLNSFYGTLLFKKRKRPLRLLRVLHCSWKTLYLNFFFCLFMTVFFSLENIQFPFSYHWFSIHKNKMLTIVVCHKRKTEKGTFFSLLKDFDWFSQWAHLSLSGTSSCTKFKNEWHASRLILRGRSCLFFSRVFFSASHSLGSWGDAYLTLFLFLMQPHNTHTPRH